MNRKRSFFARLGVAILVYLSLASLAQAYVLDTKIGEALLANSGDATELAAIEAASGNFNLEQDFKIDIGPITTAMPDASSIGQWFIDVGVYTPGYFLLKFGTGGTNATADTFFFQNIGELNKLVWNNADVQFLSGGNCRDGNQNACNIGRLSHYSGFSDNTGQVPEPATILMFGLGLCMLGFIGARRKR